MKKPRITFRQTGVRRDTEITIKADGVEVGRIEPLPPLGFYWYSVHPRIPFNTLRDPKSIDRCKAQARQVFQQLLPGLSH